jgi:hypothetical protein
MHSPVENFVVFALGMANMVSEGRIAYVFLQKIPRRVARGITRMARDEAVTASQESRTHNHQRTFFDWGTRQDLSLPLLVEADGIVAACC